MKAGLRFHGVQASVPSLCVFCGFVPALAFPSIMEVGCIATI